MAHFQATASHPYRPLRTRNVRSMHLALLLALLVLVAKPPAAQAQEDGRAILLKAIQFYHTFHSYIGQANVDTLMYSPKGEVIKHVGSTTMLKLQRPDKIYVYLVNPGGSRMIYGDGTNFSVYEVSPDQYTMVPMRGKKTDASLVRMLRVYGSIVGGFDTLFFLMQTNLPKELTDIRLKEPSTFNGHPVYVITGTTNATPVVARGGKTVTTTPTAYWTWWIDRNSSLLYKVESRTPNVIRPVAIESPKPGGATVIKNMKGTLVVRYTVSELKPDAHIAPSDFIFAPPKTAMRKRTVEEVLSGQNK